MAFSNGKDSSKIGAIKRYIGVGTFTVSDVNPDKKATEKLYNREIEKEPEYLGTVTVKDSKGNDKEVTTVRLSFVLNTVADKCNGIEAIFRTNISLIQSPWYNKDNTKVQVIDEYGRTAWATFEEVKNKTVPVYKNGKKANISENYRPAFKGEAELTDFLKNYLNIPNVQKYNRDTKEWSLVAHPEECQARLETEDLKKIFKGDFSVLREVLALQPMNTIKLAVGVRTNDEGKMYQDVYTKCTLRNSANDYTPIKADIINAKDNGMLSTTDYFVAGGLCTLMEYSPESTNFNVEDESDNSPASSASSDIEDDMPFDDPSMEF